MRKSLISLLMVVAACGGPDPAPPATQVLVDAGSAPVGLADWGILHDWDGDGDGGLRPEELDGALVARGGWGAWDADGDHRLDADEHAAMVHAIWDRDADGVVTQPEWRHGVDRWVGPGSEVALFEEWDGDGSGGLTREEVAAGLRSTYVWDSWDGNRDGLVDEVEYRRGAFATWDLDADGEVDGREWDDATRWWR